jgi:hypothetical protein
VFKKERAGFLIKETKKINQTKKDTVQALTGHTGLLPISRLPLGYSFRSVLKTETSQWTLNKKQRLVNEQQDKKQNENS